MLKPIPLKILSHKITLKVVSTVDQWQAPSFISYEVSRVHVQPTNDTRMTRDNTEVSLTSLLFVDARLSTPKLDWQALQDTSLAQGGPMHVTYDGREYVVLTIDALPDDTGALHHYEVGLV